MLALNRKLVRDLWHLRGQALAIAAVVAAGVTTAVLALSARESVRLTQAEFYDRYRFADVFASLKRAPLSVMDELRRIPGVLIAQDRVVADVQLDVRGLAEPATARLVSVPDHRRPELNDVAIRRGRYLEPGRHGEILVSEAFAGVHGLEPGDTITAIINNRRREFTVAGIALSPEYVYSMRPGTVFPDDLRFGVFWVGRKELASAFNMDGAFNDVSMALDPGASGDAVVARVDEVLRRHGGLGAVLRRNQTSHWYLEGEMTELATTALITPILFGGVAAFLLHVVVSRLVATQRDQIGTLRAFGYTIPAVALHYLALVLLIVAGGVVLGIAAGARLGRGLTLLYAQFFHFPDMLYRLPMPLVILVAIVAAVAAILGVVGAVRRAVSIPPAEAMRPVPPLVARPALVDRLGLQRLFSPATRIILRNLERRPGRALLSMAGLILATAILMIGRFSDAIEFLVRVEFGLAQRQDATVTFFEARSRRALYEIEGMPGVVRAEPFRAVAARFRNGHLTRRGAVMGVEPDATLARVLDERQRPFSIPADGLVVSEKLAQVLNLRVGDPVTIEVLEGARPVRETFLAAVVHDYLGTSAYMNLAALNRLMREGSAISGAHLLVDPRWASALYATLKETPAVAGVTITRAARDSFERTLGETMLIMMSFIVTLAAIITFGVVYNTMRVALSERAWELATLRVLGFTQNEVAAMLLGEMAILTAMAIPLGLLTGRGLAGLMMRAYDTELYRIPAVLAPNTYGLAAVVTLAAAVVSSALVWRRIAHLDLIAVLKSRE